MEVPEHIVLGDGTNRPRTRRSVAAELTQQGQPPAAKMVVPERITLGGGGNATAGFSGSKQQQALDQQALDVRIMFFMKK
jgi:hypothetical protein